MANPDRAELRLQPTSVPENPRKNSHIPSWAKASVFAARTFLAILTATPGMVVTADTVNRIQNSSIVYAAGDNCENTELDFIGISFADDPMAKYKNSNPYTLRDSLDPGDIWMGSPQFGQVVIQYTEKPHNPNANWEEVGRFNMVNNGTYSLVRIRLAGLDVNETITAGDFTGPGLFVLFYFDDSIKLPEKITGYRFTSKGHKRTINQSFWYRFKGEKIGGVYIPCGDTVLFSVGRLVIDEEFEKVIKNPNFTFRRWGNIVADFVRAEFSDFSYDDPQDNPQYRLPPLSQEETRQAFQKYLDDKKGKAALPTTSRPSSSTTPRPPTSTPIPEIRPTTTPGIPSWLWGLGAVSLAGLAAYWGYGRGNRKNPPSPPPPGSGGPNPSTAPSTGPSAAPSTGPAQPKNPEWVIGQKDFARRWQEVKSKLSPVGAGDTGNEQGYILDRFKAGMSIVHEVSLEDATNVPEMDTRLRAGIEYLISEIWPDNRIFKRFFDPQFNAGLLTPEDLARMIYLPEKCRHLPIFTRAQRTDVMRIRRTLLHALHPDLLKKDSDPKLKDSLDILLRQLNAAWPLINKLIS